MWHKSEPMDIGKMSYPAVEEHDVDWEEMYTIGNPKGKGKGHAKGKGKNTTKGASKGQNGKQGNQEETKYFPYKSHNCGGKGHKAAQCPKERTKGRGKTCGQRRGR